MVYLFQVLDKDEEPHCPHFNESVEPVNIDGLREEVSAASVVDPPPTSPPRQGRGRRSTSGRNSSTHGVEVAKFLQQRRQQTLFPQQPIVLPAGVDDEAIEFIQELRKRRWVGTPCQHFPVSKDKNPSNGLKVSMATRLPKLFRNSEYFPKLSF